MKNLAIVIFHHQIGWVVSWRANQEIENELSHCYYGGCNIDRFEDWGEYPGDGCWLAEIKLIRREKAHFPKWCFLKFSNWQPISKDAWSKFVEGNLW